MTKNIIVFRSFLRSKWCCYYWFPTSTWIYRIPCEWWARIFSFGINFNLISLVVSIDWVFVLILLVFLRQQGDTFHHNRHFFIVLFFAVFLCSSKNRIFFFYLKNVAMPCIFYASFLCAFGSNFVRTHRSADIKPSDKKRSDREKKKIVNGMCNRDNTSSIRMWSHHTSEPNE